MYSTSYSPLSTAATVVLLGISPDVGPALLDVETEKIQFGSFNEPHGHGKPDKFHSPSCSGTFPIV